MRLCWFLASVQMWATFPRLAQAVSLKGWPQETDQQKSLCFKFSRFLFITATRMLQFLHLFLHTYLNASKRNFSGFFRNDAPTDLLIDMEFNIKCNKVWFSILEFSSTPQKRKRSIGPIKSFSRTLIQERAWMMKVLCSYLHSNKKNRYTVNLTERLNG